MTPQRHQQAMELFNAAVDLAPERRAVFVRNACGTDAEMMEEVCSLLTWDASTHPAGSSELDSGFGEVQEPVALPERIGPYEILGLLGMGGMAVVYRAKQKHPDRVVALKVLRAGCGQSPSLLRFRREIDLLARLNHPGIAQIHDAGSAKDGDGETPYFAMELIDGQTITEYAESRALDRRQRLQLLIQVCEAVEYAHQRGIIHRDLKPGNILVEQGSGAGRPRVLDFGIARFLETEGDGHAFVTREHRVIGTLGYMSPEQFDPDSVVDTRSDVYALGVLGYELLAGRPPLDFSGQSPMVAIRRVQSEAAPSLGRIDPTCRGDLSLIFEKALAKDPHTRYPSVAALADDLRAFLEKRPVRARAPGRLYLFRRFTQRNPVATLLSYLTLLALIAGALGTGWGLVSAQHANVDLQNQLAEATESARFLVRDVVAGLDAVAGTAEIRRALLERLVAQIEDLRQREPDDIGLLEDYAAVVTFYSDALWSAGRGDAARTLRRRALDLYRELATLKPSSTACKAQVSIALVKLGDAHHGWANWEVVRSFYEQAYAIDQELVAAEPGSIWFLDNLAWSHDRLGYVAFTLGEFGSATRHYEDRLAITERLLELAPDRQATRHGVVTINGYLAKLATLRGDASTAEQHLRNAQEAAAQLAADVPHHRLYIEVLRNASFDLGQFLATRDRLREAAEYLDESVRAAAQLYELDSRDFHPLGLYFGSLTERASLALKLGDLGGTERHVDTARGLAESDVARLAGDDVQQGYANRVAELATELARARSDE